MSSMVQRALLRVCTVIAIDFVLHRWCNQRCCVFCMDDACPYNSRRSNLWFCGNRTSSHWNNHSCCLNVDDRDGQIVHQWFMTSRAHVSMNHCLSSMWTFMSPYAFRNLVCMIQAFRPSAPPRTMVWLQFLQEGGLLPTDGRAGRGRPTSIEIIIEIYAFRL